MIKTSLIILCLIFSTNVLATSPVDINRTALTALMANAHNINVVGDLEANRLSDVLAESFYYSNDENATLKVFNQCFIEEGGAGWGCRLSIVGSDGELESAVILSYVMTINNDTGEVEISKTATSQIAG